MNAITYKNKSSYNTIGKDLEKLDVIKLKFFQDLETSTPMIVIDLRKIKEFNYIKIENKFYFVENKTKKPNGLYEMFLRVDVLETYKEQILNSYATVRQATDFNKYLADNLKSEELKEIDIYKSNKDIEFENNNIMVTLGTRKGD